MPKIITFSDRLSLYFLKVPAKPIIEARRGLLEQGLDISVHDLAAHTLAGGDVREVSSALLEARNRGLQLEFNRACAIDLARDKSDPTQRPLAVVKRAVEPETVFFGPQGPFEFQDTARFSWRPRLRGRVVLNLMTYIGGARMEVIEDRLKRALTDIYQHAQNQASADAALSAWLQDAKQLQALADRTRYRLLDLERVD